MNRDAGGKEMFTETQKAIRAGIMPDGTEIPEGKLEQMVRLYGGASIEPSGYDEIAFIEESDGTICRLDEQELEEYIDLNQDQDFRVLRVRESVVTYIEEDTRNYMRIDTQQSKDDIKAMAIMAHSWGNLYMEVLMQYTTFIQQGMQPESAAYAAMLSWDIEIGESQ